MILVDRPGRVSEAVAIARRAALVVSFPLAMRPPSRTLCMGGRSENRAVLFPLNACIPRKRWCAEYKQRLDPHRVVGRVSVLEIGSERSAAAFPRPRRQLSVREAQS